MFFYLSKILQYLISPVIWIIVLFALSLIIKEQKLRRFLAIVAFAFLVFFTNPFIFHEFMRAWEPDAKQKTELKQKYDYVIVLTGMITYDDKYERINFKSSNDRLMQAVELYRLGYCKKIFITGGSGEIFNQKHKESDILKDFLVLVGIPECDIEIESLSKNTYENAFESAKILNPKENQNTYLLITSAYHMRRAAACFSKQGFVFDTYVTDRYSGNRKFTLDQIFVPKSEVLEGWRLLIHEVAGFIVYGAVGYR
ncbi:MAG: YdcF family protein [Bacteroidales bacterium]|nr:YdcF family protein [Bacteroidales bacterium]